MTEQLATSYVVIRRGTGVQRHKALSGDPIKLRPGASESDRNSISRFLAHSATVLETEKARCEISRSRRAAPEKTRLLSSRRNGLKPLRNKPPNITSETRGEN